MEALRRVNFLPKKDAPDSDCSLSIKDACAIVRSGDIVLFSGSSWTSIFVTLFCASQYSHIGIVYRPPGSEPMLFESIKSDDDGSPNMDVRTGKPRVGVRLVDLRLLLESFRGHAIAIRTLITPTSMNVVRDLGDHMTECLSAAIKSYGHLPYEHHWFNFLIARYKFIDLDCAQPDALFCSELVARCLQEAGLLPKSRSSVQYLPDDFSQVGDIRLLFPLAPSVIMGAHNTDIVRLSRELFVQLPTKQEKFKSV